MHNLNFSKKKIIFLMVADLLLTVAIFIAGFYAAKAYGHTDALEPVFTAVAKEVGVDGKLLKAICTVESNLNTKSYNHNDGGPENSSFGVCQVLYTTAVGFGFSDDNCKKSFEGVPAENRTQDRCKLFNVYTNIRYAAKIFKYQLNVHDGNEFFAVAAYNSGTLKICKGGWQINQGKRFRRCINGGPMNLYYLVKVLEVLNNKKQ
jgi:hypothetical protein